jgi:dTDP-4-dehydrorhamnose reductase
MRVLLTGASGFLGGVCAKLLTEKPHIKVTALRSAFRAWPLSVSMPELIAPADLNPQSLKVLLAEIEPTHILHCGALSSAELCEREPALATICNFEFTQMLATYARESESHLTTVSTDLVFDGTIAPPEGLVEEDSVMPLSTYARSKSAGEQATLALPRSAVVRMSLLYGYSPSASPGIFGWMEQRLKDKRPLALFEDEFRTPIHVHDAAAALIDLLVRDARGIWHCGGPERLSRVDFGRKITSSLGYDPGLITTTSRLKHTTAPPRPEDVSLNSKKLSLLLGRAPLDVSGALTKYAPH